MSVAAPEGTTSVRFSPRGTAELERRIAAVARSLVASDRAALLAGAQDAIRREMSSDNDLADDFARATASHAKWQRIHRYVRVVPYRDLPAEPRSRQWQRAVALVRDIGDLDLLEWTVAQADLALAEVSRGARAAAPQTRVEPTYLVLLKSVADRKRKARAELDWALTARDRGWITCTSGTLGANLIALHAASVHARDNPDYRGPCDAAFAGR